MAIIKVTLIDSMGSDLSVVNAARVSFGKKSEWANDQDENSWIYPFIDDVRVEMRHPDFVGVLHERDTKLIQYLAKHDHISPFGHCFLSFHVKAPIFVARQLVKHKFLRWNEVSRRYVDDPPEFYVPEVWRGRSPDKKQGSDNSVVINTAYYDRDDGYNTWEDDAIGVALEAYESMLELGVAPEQARMILPQNTMTEWYWSGSLDAFASMCKLRMKEDTQYESRLVANQVDNIASQWYPVSWNALVHGK